MEAGKGKVDRRVGGRIVRKVRKSLEIIERY